MGKAKAVTIQRTLRSVGAGVFLMCLLWGLPGSVQGQIVPPAARLKADYLRKMLSFVQWPGGAVPAKSGAFRFCVEGDNMLGFALGQELRTTAIDDRRVEVSWVQKEQDLRDCQALFIGNSEEKRFAKILESVRGANVLTIGEADGFLNSGGVIQLSYEGNAVRFQINLAAARNAGLKMDARFLGLAKRVVKDGETPGG